MHVKNGPRRPTDELRVIVGLTRTDRGTGFPIGPSSFGVIAMSLGKIVKIHTNTMPLCRWEFRSDVTFVRVSGRISYAYTWKQMRKLYL